MTQQQQANNPTVQALAVKLPEFYSHNPEGWFLNAEAQFVLANVTKEQTKFYHAVRVLDAKTSEEIQHFLTEQCGNTEENATPYTNLKAMLIKVYGRRKTSKMAELLTMYSFNEKGAASTLRRMRLLATDMDTMLQCKLLTMAPTSARTAVASREFNTAEDLAAALDEALEKEQFSSVATSQANVASVLPEDPTSKEPMVSSIQPARNAIRTQRKQAQNLQGICFFHSRFGSKARNCSGPPCKFADLKPQGNSQADN